MVPARKPIAPEDLIGMKAMGVTPEDVREARAGGGSLDADDLIAARAVGASPAYLKRMRAVFPDADGDDLSGASALGLDGSEEPRVGHRWARTCRDRGAPDS